MNNVLNTTMMNPFMMGGAMMGGGAMYGGDFVDVLFRHFLEHGWQGFTLMALFTFYMKLSLERIKDLIKYLNDKIAEHGKNKIEHYGSFTLEKTKTYSWELFNRLKCLQLRKPPKINVPRPVQIKETNKAVVTLNSENKTDLMALGNFLLKNKKHLHLYDYCRKNSDKYKTTEVYNLPDCMVIGYDIIHGSEQTQINMQHNSMQCSDDIHVKIIQNVDYTLISETDNKIEVLKDVKIKIPEKDVSQLSWAEFSIIARKLVSPITDYGSFKASIGWCSNPEEFYCTVRMAGILFYIYYTKNFELFKQLYKFMNGRDSFDFGGKKYTIATLPDSPPSLKDDTEMKKFIVELEKYCNDVLMPKCVNDKVVIDKWIADNKYMFEPITTVVPAIKIIFASDKMTKGDLTTYSRHFMNNLVMEYYHQNVDSIGNKISIYQLHIKYEIEIHKKENPKYAKWEEKYGSEKKEEEEEKDKKEKDEKTKPDDKKPETDKKTEGSSDKKTDGDKKTGYDKENDNRNMRYGRNNMQGEPYEYYGMSHYRYIPSKPDKFIEEEIKVPVAECVHIKSDRKPFQYLYLQKSQKELLESYLSNFKNNRDLYDKMGIPYKGGILLSGVPGCGKSSTIMAIATYLNKDIFYLDLGKIKTNEELKLCIDYIKTNSQKGGLVALEDIDCASDVVKKRSDSVETNTENTVSKMIAEEHDKLSLSYILNILDGTMAPENVIFIITTNFKEKLDPALIRPGRMDIDIRIEKCDKYQLNQIYYDLYGKYLNQKILNKFKENTFITAEVILHLFHNIYNKNIDDETLLKKFIE